MGHLWRLCIWVHDRCCFGPCSISARDASDCKHWLGPCVLDAAFFQDLTVDSDTEFTWPFILLRPDQGFNGLLSVHKKISR